MPYVLCRDDMIHVIKLACYDLTYCNAASGLYSACIRDWNYCVLVDY